MGQRLVVLVVAMVGLGVSATAVGAAPPPDLVCGQVITTDVVLRTDLTCDGDGLVVAASGVTVKLGGHTITSTNGTGAGIQLSIPSEQGSSCVSDVEIRHGTITGFFAGIRAPGGCGSGFGAYETGRVTGSTLTGNTWGAYLFNGYRLTVDRTTIIGPNGIGGPLFRSVTGSSEVTNSRIQVTSPTGYSVYSGTGYPASAIASSRLEGGKIVPTNSGYIGISNSRLTEVVVDCSDAGFGISDSRITGGGIVGTFLCGFTLSGNRFVGPGSGTAVAPRAAYFGMTIRDNVFSEWDTAIKLDGLDQSQYRQHSITGNTFRRNGVGVSCEVAPCEGAISANTFVENSGAGLLLRAGTWNVGSNTALRNGGLGIDAQGPQLTVIDDGGNVARRNLPPDCIGVVCARHPEPPAP